MLLKILKILNNIRNKSITKIISLLLLHKKQEILVSYAHILDPITSPMISEFHHSMLLDFQYFTFSAIKQISIETLAQTDKTFQKLG